MIKQKRLKERKKGEEGDVWSMNINQHVAPIKCVFVYMNLW